MVHYDVTVGALGFACVPNCYNGCSVGLLAYVP